MFAIHFAHVVNQYHVSQLSVQSVHSIDHCIHQSVHSSTASQASESCEYTVRLFP
ncbi:hypothetical protein HOF65_05860 [bacterium]|nr:hypothetical protein [bacterium]MBT3853461.1 hypothetical protein [bacterium]MBT4632425.1 hypothetical protein [bacterium]MBT6779265.1 hypothetical protein [bacterium]